jgi:hypothetical protein
MATTHLSRAEHLAQHRLLHASLDELIADFLTHNRDKLPSTTTLMELMAWSHQQTIEPTEQP